MIELRIGKKVVCFHFSFFAVLAILSLLQEARVLLIGLFVCILHELGHLLLMDIFGVSNHKILFYGAGIKLTWYKCWKLSIWKEIAVLLAGCTVNFLCFLILYRSTNVSLCFFAYASLLAGCFNLLPLKCFDGGQLIRAIASYFLPPYYLNWVEISRKVLIVLLLGIFTVCLYQWGIHSLSFWMTILYFLILECFSTEKSQ